MSSQSHYDFGLRALKSVLIGAGELKRLALFSNSSDIQIDKIETEVLIKSTCDSILPKLVAEDIFMFNSLLKAVFINSAVPESSESLLVEAIQKVCEEDSLEFEDKWADKVLQLKQVLDMRHGVMLVGPSGSGKTTAWQTLMKALSRLDGVKGEYFVWVS